MTEQELLNEIKKSAEQVTIPDSLAPEHILKSVPTKKKRRGFSFTAANYARSAAVLLFCFVLSAAAFHNQTDKNNEEYQEEIFADKKETETIQKSTGSLEQKPGTSDTAKQNAGSLYTIAKSYEEVYDTIKSSESMQSLYRAEAETDGADMAEESAPMDSATAGVEDSAYESASQKSAYSTTNLQTAGVDESDSVKTDGRYIYTVSGNKIKITDTIDNELKLAGTIAPSLGASDYILEFYTDESMLFLLVQHFETSLTEETSHTESGTDSGILPLADCAKISDFGTDASTILYTYNITEPAEPVLAGTYKQEGYYDTSRKIEDTIYLFTQKSLSVNTGTRGSYENIIPCVNEEKIPYDHIYVPDEGSEGIILSSVNTLNPQETVDQVMIVHNYVNVYVSTDAIYLYNIDYHNGDALTQIAKFSISDGIINAVNASSVKGEIYDTFAINAYRNTLRVLTTCRDNDGNTDNRLFLLDSDLNLTGSLEGIARGEEIYAARYFGNTAYFITYRNTDPLFAVDLTDTSNPVLLGELKITGFSEYLHFWEDDKLLGIGYETDPDSGMRKGLKLVMFDISNPVELKTIETVVLPDCYYSPALYQYKTVLADSSKNLIGFCAECNPTEEEYYNAYQVFSFTDGRFEERLNENLPDYQYISYDSIRGIYIDDSFYIVCPTKITAFDITNDFQKSGELNLSE